MGTSDEQPQQADQRDSRRTDPTGHDITQQHTDQEPEEPVSRPPASVPDTTAEEGLQQAPEPAVGREYRAAELAEAAGITPRTLRFYRERKLLDPPRKEGRIAWYDERHLARLHTIAALLSRGHTLGGIADLMVAFEKGKDSESAAELLGLPPELTPRFSAETPVHLTPEELAARFPGEDSPENLSAAIDLGYLSIEGDEIVHISRRLLDASTALVSEGVSLGAVLAAGQHVREQVERIAVIFAELLKEHLLSTTHDQERVSNAIELLRPYATQVVDAELSMALDRQLRGDLEEWFKAQEQRTRTEGA